MFYTTLSMPSLTPELLDNFPYSKYADPQSIQRGRAYFKDGRAWNVEIINDRKAICFVDGETGEYEVTIEVGKKTGALSLDCNCPYAEAHFCKHMIAAALAVSEYLKEENVSAEDIDAPAFPSAPSATGGNWQSQLKETLVSSPRKSPLSNLSRYVALVIMERSRMGSYGYGSIYRATYSYSLSPYIIKAIDWHGLAGDEKKSPKEIHEFLETDKKWIKAGERMFQQVNPAGCLNLDHDAASFLNLLSTATRLYGIGSSNVPMFLSMLAKFEIPVFIGSFFPNKIERRVHILPEPVEVKIDMQSDESKLVLRAGYEQNGQFNPIRENVETISADPVWVLMDDHAAQLRNTQALSILPSFPIVIPTAQVDVFRKQYFAQIAQILPIRSDIVQWQDVHAEPIPRLYLHDDKRSSPVDKRSSPVDKADKDQILRADLRFAYGEYELLPGKEESYSVETSPDSWNLTRVHRQLQREQHFYQLLTDPVYRLKRAGALHPHGSFELRARAHPFDFLVHSIPLLTQAGFEIYGQDDLKLGRINRNVANLRVSITSGIDWFDLKTVVEFGDQQIPFHDVRKALKRGEHYIKLADGSVGQIPKEWLEKYKHLWNMAEETEDGFRVSDFHLPLLDSLLEEDAALHPALGADSTP